MTGYVPESNGYIAPASTTHIAQDDFAGNQQLKVQRRAQEIEDERIRRQGTLRAGEDEARVQRIQELKGQGYSPYHAVVAAGNQTREEYKTNPA